MNSISLKVLICLLSSLLAYQNAGAQNDYHFKIDNRVVGPDKMDLDSFNYLRNNCYKLNFNFHDDRIKENYNQLMQSIDELDYLDSVYVVTQFGKAPTEKILIIGEFVPFRIAQSIIENSRKALGSDLKIQYRRFVIDNRLRDYHYYESRQILLGALSSKYDNVYKYISNPEVTELLLEAKTEEEFKRLFIEFDEKKKSYQKYLEYLNRKLRFDGGCEHHIELESIEYRLDCSNTALQTFLEEQIISKFEPESKTLRFKLLIDTTGKVKKVEALNNYTNADLSEIIQVFYNMPKWIPKKEKDGNSIEAEYIVHLYF